MARLPLKEAPVLINPLMMLKEESIVARKTIKDHMLSNVFNLT